jgi:5'-deoxy-5'-methylthioadenosine phosphorylase
MLAIIGGSGLDTLPDLRDARATPLDTPFGRSATLWRGRFAGADVLFLPRHDAGHRLPPHRINYRANIRALADAGARDVIAVATVGGIVGHPPGSLAVPRQVVDYTSGRDATFFDGDGNAVTHVDFTEPYAPRLRAALIAAGRDASVALVDGGVYAAVNGPRLETAAEIDRLERDGATMVGMTGMPEAALAREAGLAYAALTLSVNHAAGRGDSAAGISHDALMQVLATGMRDVCAILAALAQRRGTTT